MRIKIFKNIAFLLIALTFATQSTAQEYVYVPLVREGVQWINVWQRDNVESGNTDRCISALAFKGTQEYQGKIYQALYLSTLQSNCDEKAVADENEPVALLREEDKRIYAVDLQEIHHRHLCNDDKAEVLIYDFNEIGNSFLCQYYHLQPNSQVEQIIDGVAGKLYNCDFGRIVEQVGYDSEDAILLPFRGGPNDGSTLGLAMVKKDGKVIYNGTYASLIQDDSYVPLVREGVQWVHFWSLEWALVGEDERFAKAYIFEFRGTEVIDGVEYAKLYSYLEGESLDESKEPVAYVREQDKVVYRRWDKSSNEEVIYDFNNMANVEPEWYNEQDEGKEYTYTIEDVVVAGQVRKKHIYAGWEIVEGVGCLNNYSTVMDGIFPVLPDDGSTNGLSHVIENGEVVIDGERRSAYLEWGSGDANADGLLNGSDVTSLYSNLLNREEDGDLPATVGMDVNRDGLINGADVTALYDRLLQ